MYGQNMAKEKEEAPPQKLPSEPISFEDFVAQNPDFLHGVVGAIGDIEADKFAQTEQENSVKPIQTPSQDQRGERSK